MLMYLGAKDDHLLWTSSRQESTQYLSAKEIDMTTHGPPVAANNVNTRNGLTQNGDTTGDNAGGYQASSA